MSLHLDNLKSSFRLTYRHGRQKYRSPKKLAERDNLLRTNT